MRTNLTMKWAALLCMGLLGVQVNMQAFADNAQDEATAAANAANREMLLKGGKMSVRQSVAVAKAKVAEQNSQTGESFLATNKAKPGVVSLPSGLQYRVLKAAGSGKRASENNAVRCRYLGKLTDGTTIDQSDESNPEIRPVAGFLPGLKEAIKLMPTGSKWEVVIPPQLAYGAQGSRGVGPNAVLVYVIEVLEIS